MTYQYIVSLPSVAETNETLIAKKTVRVLDCSVSVPESNECNLWNFAKCPGDAAYCNPFYPGDILYSQFHSPKGYFNNISYDVIDTATGLAIAAGSVTGESGQDDNFTAFLNIIVDTTNITAKCFYIKIRAYKCKLDRDQKDTLEACVADLMEEGKSFNEAMDICLGNLCPEGIQYFYSEPYCNAGCRTSILLEGVYPQKDCNGNLYAPFTSNPPTNSYKNQIRVFGEINSVGFTIEEVTLNGKDRTSSDLDESFLLRTSPIPYYVANKIAVIFAAKEFYIDGVRYYNSVDLQKNNDENNMWLVSTTVTRGCGPIDFTCNT